VYINQNECSKLAVHASDVMHVSIVLVTSCL